MYLCGVFKHKKEKDYEEIFNFAYHSYRFDFLSKQ